jgi:hypothetical protein
MELAQDRHELCVSAVKPLGSSVTVYLQNLILLNPEMHQAND